ncbi:MAG: hypothetical protein ABIR87_01240 [Sphingomicrobium sp.]
MLNLKTILIVEENAYVALDLVSAVEGNRGTVVGPVATAVEALEIVDSKEIHAAIVDADVSNIASLASRLGQGKVPLVFQAGAQIPAAVRPWVDPTTILYRPVDPAMMVSMLAIAIDRTDDSDG